MTSMCSNNLRVLMSGPPRGVKDFVGCPQMQCSIVCPTAAYGETVTFLLQDTVLPNMQVKSKLFSLLVLCYKSICSFCLLVILRSFRNMPLGYFHPIECIPESVPEYFSVFSIAVACFFLYSHSFYCSCGSILVTLTYFEVSQCPQSCPHCGLSGMNEDIRKTKPHNSSYGTTHIDRLLLYPVLSVFSFIVSPTIITVFLKLHHFYTILVSVYVLFSIVIYPTHFEGLLRFHESTKYFLKLSYIISKDFLWAVYFVLAFGESGVVCFIVS